MIYIQYLRTIYQKQRKNTKGDSRYICQNELDKKIFWHPIAYGNFKDLTRRTASYNIMRVKHLILLKIQNMMDIKEVLLLWFVHFLIKSLKVVLLIIKCKKMSNWLKNCISQLLENLKREEYIYHSKKIFWV